MFSSSIVRRGPSSIVKPRCNSVGLGQLSTAAVAAASGARRRQGAALIRAAATGRPQGSSAASASTAAAGHGSRLLLKKEAESVAVVGQHRHAPRPRCALHQARTFGAGVLVHAPRLKDGEKQRAIGASTNRQFAAAGEGPADTDSDGSSESESEFEGTMFGTARPLQPAAEDSSAAAAATEEASPAAKKTSKGRKPWKRRTSNSESSAPSPPSAEAEAEAEAAAEAAAPPAAAEAAATKKPRARKPRKRRTTAGQAEGTTPSPAAEPAEGAAATAVEAAEEEAAATKKPRARKPRKRRTTAGQAEGTTPSPAAEPAEGAAATAAEAAEEEAAATKKPRARKTRKRRTTTGQAAGPAAEPAEGAATATAVAEAAEEEAAASGADIPKSRKDAFERARRAGVAQRAQEGGGNPLASDSDSDNESPSLGDDDSSFWQGSSKPARPEGFPAEGPANASKQRTKQRRSMSSRHPVLGHFVADLKYKRVYVTSVEALLQAPVFEKARTFRPVHAAEICQAKMLEADRLEIRMIEEGKIEEKGEMEKKAKGLPGVITLYQRPLLPLSRKQQKYTFGIVDGQHRLGALLLLAEEGLWDRSEQNVVVEVFDTKDEKEIAELFLDINKGESIKVDLGQPGPDEAQKCADTVILHFYNEYRAMFGSKRARPPHLHAITFKENLLASGLIERHELFDPDLLLDYLLRVNKMLSERDAKMWELMIGPEEGGYNSKKTLQAALGKAQRHNFWLGMELSWMLV